MNKIFIGILLIALAVLSVLMPACSGRVSEEAGIKAVIKEMAEHAESKDLAAFKKHVSKDYKDPAGNDYNQLKGIVLYYFMQPESIYVLLRKTDVEVKDGKGYATVRAVVTRGRKVTSVKDLLPSNAGGFVFDLVFVKKGGDWVLSSAIWRQVGIGEAL